MRFHTVGDPVCLDGAVTDDRPLPEEPSSGSIRQSVRADFDDSSWRQRVLLLLTVGWLGYEWGLGNETVTPWVLVRVISESDGVWTIVAAGAVGFAFTTSQQLLAAVTTAAGFSMFRGTARAAWVRLRARMGRQPREWSQLPLVTRALLVFTLGTTAVVLIQISFTGRVGFTPHRRTIVQAAALCGVLVGAVGAVVGSLTLLGRSVDALEPTTDRILRVLGNPMFWVGLLLIALVVGSIRNRAATPGAAANS